MHSGDSTSRRRFLRTCFAGAAVLAAGSKTGLVEAAEQSSTLLKSRVAIARDRMLRGIDTLPWRVRAQSENAMLVTRFLEEHRAVEKVHYPGLPTHPGHRVAARQMKGGFGGMLSIRVSGGEAAAIATAANVVVLDSLMAAAA